MVFNLSGVFQPYSEHHSLRHCTTEMVTLKVTLLLFIAFVAIQSTRADGPVFKRDLCVCPRILMPVCASNGKTYSNECEFNCAREAAKEKGMGDMYIVRNGDCDMKKEKGLYEQIAKIDDIDGYLVIDAYKAGASIVFCRISTKYV